MKENCLCVNAGKTGVRFVGAVCAQANFQMLMTGEDLPSRNMRNALDFWRDKE